MEKKNSNILVIYHNNCWDGLASAWVCSRNLPRNANITFTPYNYGVKAPHLIGFTDVYIVDFSFPKEEMLYLLDNNPTVNFINIDHHKTAEPLREITASNFHFIKNINYCGAVLTWKHFHPDCSNMCVPLFLQYVQDRDLWSWVLPESKAVNAYIRSLSLGINDLDNMISAFNDADKFNSFIAKGLAILEDEANYIKEAIQEVKYLYLSTIMNLSEVESYKVPYVKVDKLASEVLEALYKQENADFAIGWREWDNNQIKLEFRSDGNIDVSVVAKCLGGGGHRAASGTQISKEKAIELGINIGV